MIGVEIINEARKALNTATIPRGWNDTDIMLIPKVSNPDNMTQFRPINLCNLIYKIIKCWLVGLKESPPDIISHSRGAFVPGRLIADNVLVAYEVFHSIKNRRKGKNGLCAVKLDMNKAYHSVEWFLGRYDEKAWISSEVDFYSNAACLQ